MSHPILIIYEALVRHRVRFLLMGGQACIVYGASEFTRDCDFCVFCDKTNIDCLSNALTDLAAVNTFFPPLEIAYLQRGHACHFICGIENAKGFRIDVMAKMRNCPDFETMWKDRTIHRFEGFEIPVMSVNHLVSAKKTQRDKDWPMVRRLVEEDYRRNRDCSDKAGWWLLESRTPRMLIDLSQRFPELSKSLWTQRPLLRDAFPSSEDTLEEALLQEEFAERRKDRVYWEPLKIELEKMRHGRRKQSD